MASLDTNLTLTLQCSGTTTTFRLSDIMAVVEPMESQHGWVYLRGTMQPFFCEKEDVPMIRQALERA